MKTSVYSNNPHTTENHHHKKHIESGSLNSDTLIDSIEKINNQIMMNAEHFNIMTIVV